MHHWILGSGKSDHGLDIDDARKKGGSDQMRDRFATPGQYEWHECNSGIGDKNEGRPHTGILFQKSDFLTDGQFSAHHAPARGEIGYGLLSRQLRDGSEFEFITLGLGHKLTTWVLCDIGDYFIHMNDPGAIGPVSVNLIGYLKSRVKLVEETSFVFNNQCVVVYFKDGTNEVMRAMSYAYDSYKTFELRNEGDILSICIGGKEIPYTDVSTSELYVFERAKFRVCEHLKSFASLPAEKRPASVCLEGFKALLAEFTPDTFLNPLCVTLSDEIIPGIEQNMDKWGIHYAATLYFALLRCQRTSFRDVCLQHYCKEGTVIEKFSNSAEETFTKSPAPTPSLLRQNPSQVNRSLGAPTPPAPVYFSDEFMRGGGCFHPDTVIETMNGTSRFVDLQKGMYVKTARGFDVIEMVVFTKTNCSGAVFSEMPGGVRVTEYHPFKREGKWHFPVTTARSIPLHCEVVVNLIMRNRANIIVGDIEFCTLGHGVRQDVVQHEFYGSDRVVAHVQNFGVHMGNATIIDPVQLAF